MSLKRQNELFWEIQERLCERGIEPSEIIDQVVAAVSIEAAELEEAFSEWNNDQDGEL